MTRILSRCPPFLLFVTTALTVGLALTLTLVMGITLLRHVTYDHGFILMLSDREPDNQLFVLDPLRGTTFAVGDVSGVSGEKTIGLGSRYQVRLSPTGSGILYVAITFISPRDDTRRTLTYAIMSGNVWVRVDAAHSIANPVWSPDGRQQAYQEQFGDNVEIMITDAAGQHSRNLTHHPADDFWVAWLPGDLLAVAIGTLAPALDNPAANN